MSVCAGLEYLETQALYSETSQMVEKWMKILHFAILKVTVMLSTSSALIVSFFKYFATDLGDSASELPLPIHVGTLVNKN